MIKTININGSWSKPDNAWVSSVIRLTGDAWLEATLPQKGRIVIKKAETERGPWPKALISKWDGPDFKITLYGSTKCRFIRIYLTTTPTNIQITSV